MVDLVIIWSLFGHICITIFFFFFSPQYEQEHAPDSQNCLGWRAPFETILMV